MRLAVVVPALTLLAYLTACYVANLAGRVAVARALGAPIVEVGLFFGPKVLQFRRRGILYSVGLLPLGNFVKFRAGSDEDKPDPEEDLPDFPRDPRGPATFQAMHPLARVAIAGSASATLVALACLGLGLGDGLGSVYRGFGQLVRGALSPSAVGRPLVLGLLDLLRTRPANIGLGVVAAKLAAANLLPLPTTDGGQVFLNLLGWRKRWPERVAGPLALIGTLATFVLFGGWVIAFARVMAGR